MQLKRHLGLGSAIIIVIASMFGTGIFITTGIVLGMVRDASVVLMLWGLGGVTAMAGSLCYAELASIWPDAGGEYVYLKNTFGLLPAFLTGWISLTVGFSASVATAAITAVEYFNQFTMTIQGGDGGVLLLPELWMQKLAAAIIIILLGAIHIHGVKEGSIFQNFLTMMKVILIVALIALGVSFIDWSGWERLTTQYPPMTPKGEVTSSAGLALLIIMFSFSGWNAAVYMAGEIKDPEHNLPRALIIGNSIMIVLYIILNVVFLMAAPGSELIGQEAVGAISARNLFGPGISRFFTLGIVIILLSSVSVQMMTGPRVSYAMAQDRMIFRGLGRINPRFGSPSIAIVIQILLSVLYVIFGSAQSLMEYMGFALSIFPLLTVIAMVYLRITRPDLKRRYKVPMFPLVPIVFIGLSLAMMISGFLAWTATARFAIVVTLSGIPVYFLWKRFVPNGGNGK